jgi:hypothetical protein
LSLVWALPLAFAMQTRAASVSPRPVAWAAQSPRPASCLAAPGLWEVSRQAVIERRCRQLARGQALLLRAPQQAFERAAALLAEAPELAEARVLRGRASLRLGRAGAALADLLPLIADEAPAVADPAALLDGGRAALAQGDLANATRFYRRLGSRASVLPDRDQQLVAYLEIAGVVLATDPAADDEVLAYLREARRRSAGSGFSGLIAGLTALAWAAQGREAEALGALSDLADPWSLERFEPTPPAARLVWLPAGLLQAVLGLALERRDATLSRSHYAALAQSALGKTRLGQLASRGSEAGKRRAR